MTSRIVLLGEYNPQDPLHQATNAAIDHTRASLSVSIEFLWVSTAEFDVQLLKNVNGLWVATGSPYKNMTAALDAIQFVREHQIPCLGTCGGFQHMILEYARNVLGFVDAHHAEYDPYASRLILSKLACSLVGREMRLQFEPGSQVAEIYGGTSAQEKYYCNFGVNSEYVSLFQQGPLKIAGHDAEGEIRVIELPSHPFFVGTLFVPQVGSKPGSPHPVVRAFAQAANAHQRT